MRQERVDGVATYIAEGPAPLAAGLVFGVGRRDETFTRGGLTHLVEHLAMSTIGRTTLDVNASVDLASTEFTATGRPERVAEFLRSVCLALVDLPTERLPIEAGVLAAEDGHVASPAVAGLLAELYGAVGLGLAAVRDPALLSLTPADVRQWAAHYFTRDNAALWLAGPVPEHIALPLPSGARPQRAPQTAGTCPSQAGWSTRSAPRLLSGPNSSGGRPSDRRSGCCATGSKTTCDTDAALRTPSAPSRSGSTASWTSSSSPPTAAAATNRLSPRGCGGSCDALPSTARYRPSSTTTRLCSRSTSTTRAATPPRSARSHRPT